MQVKVEKDVSQISIAQLCNEVPVCNFTVTVHPKVDE